MQVKKILTSSCLLISALICFILIGAFKDPIKRAGDLPAGATGQSQPEKFSPPPLPEQISFCGEAVPLDDRITREQFDREVLYNYYLPNNILYIIKLSRRYFPMIEQRLKRNGIPEDMKYLCVAESNLQQLVSKAGAAGFWQFMPATATGMGMRINKEVDERYNIEKATDAACVYLKDAYRRFGSWTAAAAAYNTGQGNYNKAATTQGTKNYYELQLHEETNRYIFRILTFKYFLEEAETLGFEVSEEEGYAPLKLNKIPVTQSIPDLSTYARAAGLNLKILKTHNPWIKGNTLSVSGGNGYILIVPQL